MADLFQRLLQETPPVDGERGAEIIQNDPVGLVLGAKPEEAESEEAAQCRANRERRRAILNKKRRISSFDQDASNKIEGKKPRRDGGSVSLTSGVGEKRNRESVEVSIAMQNAENAVKRRSAAVEGAKARVAAIAEQILIATQAEKEAREEIDAIANRSTNALERGVPQEVILADVERVGLVARNELKARRNKESSSRKKRKRKKLYVWQEKR